jgi:hypothetical protein
MMTELMMDVDAPSPHTHAAGKAPAASAGAGAGSASGVDREALRDVALALYEADEALQGAIEAARGVLGGGSAHPLPPRSVSSEEILEYARVATRVRPFRDAADATWLACVRACCGSGHRACVRVGVRCEKRMQP